MRTVAGNNNGSTRAILADQQLLAAVVVHHHKLNSHRSNAKITWIRSPMARSRSILAVLAPRRIKEGEASSCRRSPGLVCDNKEAGLEAVPLSRSPWRLLVSTPQQQRRIQQLAAGVEGIAQIWVNCCWSSASALGKQLIAAEHHRLGLDCLCLASRLIRRCIHQGDRVSPHDASATALIDAAR